MKFNSNVVGGSGAIPSQDSPYNDDHIIESMNQQDYEEDMQRRREVERRPLDSLCAHDLAQLRRIIAEVIERGDNFCHTEMCVLYHPWAFEFHFPEHEDEQPRRQRFITRVIESVIATAVPATAEQS